MQLPSSPSVHPPVQSHGAQIDITASLPLEDSRHTKGESSLLTNELPFNVLLCRDAMRLSST